jgi:toxin FitB
VADDERYVLDSSGWIEWLSGGTGATNFEPLVAAPERVIVPAIVVYETVRWALLGTDANRAQSVAVRMRLSQVVDVDADLAVAAARISQEYRLAMADSIIYATARRFEAELWTQDTDFARLHGVRHFPKVS